jgi:hypothetical protein
MSADKKKWKSLAVSRTDLPSIHEFVGRPLEAGLWCLYVSKEDCGVDYQTPEELENILQEFLDIPISALSITRAFARAGKKLIRSPQRGGFKISNPGEVYLKGLKKNEPLNVVYINPSKPRTAKKDLESLIKSIPKGELLICDPYYGLRTLEVLEVFAKYHKRIKFLTARVGGGEKQATLSHAVSDFKKEYGNRVELRVASSKDLHDRYIVGSNHILIVGHGIKDLGSKESLIVVVEDRYGRDIRKIITTNFNARWTSAAAI